MSSVYVHKNFKEKNFGCHDATVGHPGVAEFLIVFSETLPVYAHSSRYRTLKMD